MRLWISGFFMLMGFACAPQPRVSALFTLVMENRNWSEFFGSDKAPYFNNTLLPQAAYARNYYNPKGLHPSEPNYIWMEAGDNLGIRNNDFPSGNHQSTPLHLTRILKDAGITWKSYQEDIAGTVCPFAAVGNYVPRHNPNIYFDDVTGSLDPNDAYCIAHNRPYTELATDLQAGTVSRFNFITPNLCNDGHDLCAPYNNSVQQVDTWLSTELPKILASAAYRSGGVVFITWDEGLDGVSDGPIGLIVLSPFGKGGGYSNNVPYTHSSLLRTWQELLRVQPYLRDAERATSLKDLFLFYP